MISTGAIVADARDEFACRLAADTTPAFATPHAISQRLNIGAEWECEGRQKVAHRGRIA